MVHKNFYLRLSGKIIIVLNFTIMNAKLLKTGKQFFENIIDFLLPENNTKEYPGLRRLCNRKMLK